MDEIIINFVNGIVLSIVGLISRQRLEKRQMEILRSRLLKDGYRWRTFGSLMRSIRADDFTTRELLIKLGAEASTAEKNVWKLRSR